MKFSLVVQHNSILLIVSMHNLKWEQVDVKTTLLHGELNEQIYMQQPEFGVSFEPITQAMV